MKKTTITIMTICLMSFSLAFYPGETITFSNDMGIENLVYTIIGNSSPIGELDVEINSSNVTITFPGDMTPDSFDIIFIEEQTREVVKVVRRGGSSGGTKYVDRNVTVPQPVFYDRNVTNTETLEVEKMIDNTTVVETGYRMWHLLLAIAVGGLFIWAILYKKKQKSAEEIMEDVYDDEGNRLSEEEILESTKVEEDVEKAE